MAAEPQSKKREWGRGVWNFSRLRCQLSLNWYSGSTAKSPSPSTQYHQLRRLFCRKFTFYYAYFLDSNSYRVLNSWKSLEICPAIFQTWRRVINPKSLCFFNNIWHFLIFLHWISPHQLNGDKVWKNGLKTWGFFVKKKKKQVV